MTKADPFRDMASRVDACDEREFGGALVLVAPDGKKIEFLLTDPASGSNLIAFWGFVQARIQDAFNEMSNQSGMGGFQPQRLPR